MEKIKIIVINYNTPEFIEYQYSLLKKFLNNDFEYVVYDTSPTHKDTEKYSILVRQICKDLNITLNIIPNYIYGVPQIENLAPNDKDQILTYPDWDVSTRAGKGITYAIQDCINKGDTKILLIDADMFLISPLDLSKYYDKDMVGIPSTRLDQYGEYLNYFTNQLFFINTEKIEDKRMIDFSPCTINDRNLDCGGKLYYILKIQPELNIHGLGNNLLTSTDDSFFNNQDLKDFISSDTEIVNQSFQQQNNFVEIYDFSFLHFRAGTNWINIKGDRTENLYKFLNILLYPNIIKKRKQMKKIISYSLYNKRPKDVLNAVINCMLAEKIYPDWICRFYIDDTIPEEINKALETFKNVEIIKMPTHTSSAAMLWRFLPASEDDVEIMISRDGDSWLNEREKVCVDEFLASDKKFHIIRDHCYHSQKIMGGMWGAKLGIVSNMKDLIEEFIISGTYDQGFLAEKIYPSVLPFTLIHTSPQWDNQGNFLPNGYFNDGIKPIPAYNDNTDEVIPGLSFKMINSENSFFCAHCKKNHEVLIGGIMENMPKSVLNILYEYFTSKGINTEIITTQPNF